MKTDKDLPFPGTKEWRKEFAQALQNPNFKLERVSRKELDASKYTSTQYKNLVIARAMVEAQFSLNIGG